MLILKVYLKNIVLLVFLHWMTKFRFFNSSSKWHLLAKGNSFRNFDLKFSKGNLYWLINYLSNLKQILIQLIFHSCFLLYLFLIIYYIKSRYFFIYFLLIIFVISDWYQISFIYFKVQISRVKEVWPLVLRVIVSINN